MNNKNSMKGFTLLQLLITFAVVAIVSTAAVLGIKKSRTNLALQNSVRLLAANMEKARLDAVRRHANTSVVFTSESSYNVTMDFGGSGEPYTRTFDLNGAKIVSSGLPSASFNWRGRTNACTLQFTLSPISGEDQSWVSVSDAGDVTINSDVDVLPDANFTSVNSSSDIYSTTVVSGSTVRPNAADCPADSSSSTPGPPITATGQGGCTVQANPSSQTIRKNGGSTGTIVITSSTAVTAAVTAPTNLTVSPATASIPAGGSQTFTVVSTNNARSTFAVNFATPCTTATSLIKVTN